MAELTMPATPKTPSRSTSQVSFDRYLNNSGSGMSFALASPPTSEDMGMVIEFCMPETPQNKGRAASSGQDQLPLTLASLPPLARVELVRKEAIRYSEEFGSDYSDLLDVTLDKQLNESEKRDVRTNIKPTTNIDLELRRLETYDNIKVIDIIDVNEEDHDPKYTDNVIRICLVLWQNTETTSIRCPFYQSVEVQEVIPTPFEDGIREQGIDVRSAKYDIQKHYRILYPGDGHPAVRNLEQRSLGKGLFETIRVDIKSAYFSPRAESIKPLYIEEVRRVQKDEQMDIEDAARGISAIKSLKITII